MFSFNNFINLKFIQRKLKNNFQLNFGLSILNSLNSRNDLKNTSFDFVSNGLKMRE